MYSFRPYIYGSFSRELYNDIDWLEMEGVLRERTETINKDEVCCAFELTVKGANEVKAKIEHLKDIFEIVRSIKEEYNQMNLAQLVRQIHQDYPGYVQEVSANERAETRTCRR